MIRKIVVILCLIISLYADYDQIKIRDFINIVATQNHINIVINKDIDVNFDFYINSPIEKDINIEVLRDVLLNNGYVLIKKNDYYFVTNKEEMLINKIEIYHLDYADTKVAAKHIEKILNSYYESLKIIKSTSNKKQLTPLDENKNRDHQQTEETQVKEKFNFSVTPLDNKSIAVSYKDSFVPDVVLKILRSIDVERKRILIRAKIYEVNTNALKELGSQFGLFQSDENFHINANTHNLIVAKKVVQTVTDQATTINSFPLSITGVIKALEQNGDAKITAQPKILIYEGGTAYLNAGKSYPISTESTTVQNNQTTSTKNYKNVDTGVTLSLQFKEFRAGNIFLKFDLKIDNVEKYETQDNQIITTKRELRSDLKFKPGREIDLAGLAREVKSNSISGIPLLKDIPWLGRLFQIETNETDSSMIVIQLQADLI